ncbi:MAG: glycosyltransferase family 1 protein, partial [Candidatus Lokiarchaeota archaeon]|nr:glycosyltransferase family 1 protein [Candidatus Lokiarchaeota archaeon]
FRLRTCIFPFFYLLFLIIQGFFFRISIFLNFLKEKWNIIHAQDPLAVIYALFLKKLYKIPIIFTQHGFFVNETLLYLKKSRQDKIIDFLKKIEKKAIDESSKIITVEESRFKYLKKYRKDEIYLMENYIDTNFFKKYQFSKNYFINKFPEYKNSFILITPKRLNEYSNIPFLIDLAEKMKKKDLKVIFFIFGYGSEKKKLQTLIIKKNLSKFIKILSPFPRNQMPFIYNSANAVIIPSKELKGVIEGSSYSVLEAMACEKPVLLSKIKPFEDIITHLRTGILFDLKNPEEALSWIQRIRDDPKLYSELGNNARKFVKNNNSLELKIPELLKIYGIFK